VQQELKDAMAGLHRGALTPGHVAFVAGASAIDGKVVAPTGMTENFDRCSNPELGGSA